MQYIEEYKRWLSSEELVESERRELISIENDSEKKQLRFSSPMGFGTAGLRSTMYMGIGCMNRFTVAMATRAIAALVKRFEGETRGVAIAYDSRNNSKEFAEVSAAVLCGAGIRVYLFDGIRPTPELSFTVRRLSCIAGINITASHNPKEYNGYKAYWEDGAQISPELAKIVSEEMSKHDVLDTSCMMEKEEALNKGLLTILDEKFDGEYLDAVLSSLINPDIISEVSDELKVVYTPLHGAGYKLVPEIFKRAGLKHLYTVSEQMIPDGNFPTVEKPNPEYAAVFSLGVKIADKTGSDLIIATDPDSDRVGVMTRCESGSFVPISGNQMGALLLDYAIKARAECGKLLGNAYCVKSIVSTDMAYEIARRNNVKLYDVLTGFKYIGEVIKNYEDRGESDGFVMGFEESYGYLFGSYARDKDAVGASAMILEMTAFYKKRGMTLYDALRSLYLEYGYFGERTVDIYMEGLDGIERRRRVMESLRKAPPQRIAEYGIVKIADYSSGKIYDLLTGATAPTGQPKSDVIYFVLENDDKIIIRPSGTEPKIKIYSLIRGNSEEEIAEKAKKYEAEAKEITNI
jgi:phosphoglucomutase